MPVHIMRVAVTMGMLVMVMIVLSLTQPPSHIQAAGQRIIGA